MENGRSDIVADEAERLNEHTDTVADRADGIFFPVTNCFPGINACALFKAVVRSIPSLITDKENKRIVINKETDLFM